jgi:hypothetical protein
MIPSSLLEESRTRTHSTRQPIELKSYSAREWKADVAFFLSEKKVDNAKPTAKAEHVHAKPGHHPLVNLKHLFIRWARVHR